MNKFRALIATLILGLGIGIAALHAPVAKAETDSWSSRNEAFVTGGQSINTIALISTAVASNKLNVRAIDFACSAAGTVSFYSGSTVTGTKLIGSFYLAANTPRQLTENNFGQGMKTASGEGLYAAGINGTLTYTIRVRTDPN